MSRSETKMRKSQRLEKNAELKKNGRTAQQVKVKKMKKALKEYTKKTGYKFIPIVPGIVHTVTDEFQTRTDYTYMHRMIADENKRLRKESEALRIKQEHEEEIRKLEKEEQSINNDSVLRESIINDRR